MPYADAANWVHSFDVALIPFQLTELTLCTSPVKVYEYLAAGKPVVATALPELQLMGDWVQVAENADQFTQHLGAAMMRATTSKGPPSGPNGFANTIGRPALTSWRKPSKRRSPRSP